MKKLILTLAMTSVVALTACQKEVTEVKKGSKVEVNSQALSTNNAADVNADMDKIQTLAMSQESKAGDLNARLSAALESQNEDEVKKLFPEFKVAMLDNLKELQALKLQSSEVNELRKKLNEMTQLGLTLQEKLLDKNVKPEALQSLQAQGGQLQQDIMVLSQKIQTVSTAGQQPVFDEESIKKALAEQMANQPEVAPQPAQ